MAVKAEENSSVENKFGVWGLKSAFVGGLAQSRKRQQIPNPKQKQGILNALFFN
jgi:hypothetical protein